MALHSSHASRGKHSVPSSSGFSSRTISQHTAPKHPAPKPKPTGTAELVLGILSIVLAGPIGLVLGIIALVRSNTALRSDPDLGHAAAARIVGIVGIAASAIVTILLIVHLAGAFGGPQPEGQAPESTTTTEQTASQGGAIQEDDEEEEKAERAAVIAAVDAAIESVIMPDADDKSEAAADIAGIIESEDMSFEDLGMTADDFTTWMYEDAAYTRGDIQIEGDVAYVTCTITTHKVDTLMNGVNESAEDMDYATITDMSTAYEELGKIMKEKMEASTPTSKTVELTLGKEDGVWTVDDLELENLAYEVFFEE